MSRSLEDKNFDNILLEAIDEAFLVLGESVKKSFYNCLEQRFYISRQDILFRLDDFSDALERIFGIASKHVEILIMKKLCQKIECCCEWKGPNWLVPNITLLQYISLARLSFEENKGKIGEFEVIIDAAEQKQQV